MATSVTRFSRQLIQRGPSQQNQLAAVARRTLLSRPPMTSSITNRFWHEGARLLTFFQHTLFSTREDGEVVAHDVQRGEQTWRVDTYVRPRFLGALPHDGVVMAARGRQGDWQALLLDPYTGVVRIHLENLLPDQPRTIPDLQRILRMPRPLLTPHDRLCDWVTRQLAARPLEATLAPDGTTLFLRNGFLLDAETGERVEFPGNGRALERVAFGPHFGDQPTLLARDNRGITLFWPEPVEIGTDQPRADALALGAIRHVDHQLTAYAAEVAQGNITTWTLTQIL